MKRGKSQATRRAGMRPGSRSLTLRLTPHHPPNIIYTPAHTNSSSTPSTVNALADHLASGPQVLTTSATSRTLTYLLYGLFYALLTKRRLCRNKYIIVFAFRAHFHSVFSPRVSAQPRRCCCRSMTNTPLPSILICGASSAYSALVQLYARSDQLDTTYTRFRRFGNVSPMCVSGCDALETVHHVFVSCPVYHTFRQHATQSLITETSRYSGLCRSTAVRLQVLSSGHLTSL